MVSSVFRSPHRSQLLIKRSYVAGSNLADCNLRPDFRDDSKALFEHRPGFGLLGVPNIGDVLVNQIDEADRRGASRRTGMNPKVSIPLSLELLFKEGPGPDGILCFQGESDPLVMGLHPPGLLKWNLAVLFGTRVKRRGIFGAFLLGLLFGIVSTPCVVPILAVLLAFVA